MLSECQYLEEVQRRGRYGWKVMRSDGAAALDGEKYLYPHLFGVAIRIDVVLLASPVARVVLFAIPPLALFAFALGFVQPVAPVGAALLPLSARARNFADTDFPVIAFLSLSLSLPPAPVPPSGFSPSPKLAISPVPFVDSSPIPFDEFLLQSLPAAAAAAAADVVTVFVFVVKAMKSAAATWDLINDLTTLLVMVAAFAQLERVEVVVASMFAEDQDGLLRP